VRWFLVLLLTVCTAPVFAQSSAPGSVQYPPTSVPPGFPSPSQAPIPQFPGNTTKAASIAPLNTQPLTIAPPEYAPPVDELGPNDIGLEDADSVYLDSEDNATVKGNVRLRYRTYTLYCDQAQINADTGIGVLNGHVRLISDDKKVTVTSLSPDSRLTLNMRTGVYDVIGGSAVIAPSDLPSVTGLALPIRLYGGDIQDNPRFIDARDTSATTCNFATPHYFFRAHNTIIIPGKRLIARDVTLYRRNRKVITIPYLLFPLDDRYAHEGLVPQVGVDSQEGYFAKFAVPYVLVGAAVGILRLDLMSKEGVGTGFIQSFTTSGSHSAGGSLTTVSSGNQVSSGPSTTAPSSAGSSLIGLTTQNGGTVQLYHLADNGGGLDTTTGSLADNQLLFHNVRLAIDSQFQNDSYLSSESQSNAISSQFTLGRAVKGADTTFSTNLQQSDYGLGTSRTITSSLDQNNNVSNTTDVDVKLDYSQFDSPSYGNIRGSSQDTLATTLDVTSHPKGYQIELTTNTFSATSSGSAGIISGGVQKLPELNIQSVPSPTNELLPHLLPALSKYILDFGDFKETVDNTQDERLQLGLDTGNNVIKHKAVTNSYSGSFLQSLYSDNTAQYILQDQVGSTYAFQKQSTVGLEYSYLRPYGYTPFLFDETGTYNNVNANINYQPTKRFLATVSSGFDIGQDHSVDGEPAAPWLDINGQIEYRIDSRFINVLTGSYDPNRGMLFNVTDSTRVTLPWGFGFNSAANYVPQSDRFSAVNADLNVPWITDKREQAGYTLRALAGYDGFTDQITYDGFELTRTWHDWELSGIYQNNTNSTVPGSSFYINFRLKAFPGFEPFGVGQFGQGLDTGTGQVY